MTRLRETRSLVVRGGRRSYGWIVMRRRWRRARSSSAAIASNDRDGIDGLRAWVLSLPFVNELRGGVGDEDIRQFVVDCPPLRVRRVWLVIGVTEADPEVLAFVTHDDGDITCVGFGMPLMTSDPGRVEAALLVAYQSTFAGSWPSTEG
jgi:hypothetical protein